MSTLGVNTYLKEGAGWVTLGNHDHHGNDNEDNDDDSEYSHESQVDKIHLTGSLTASPPAADTVTTF